MKVLLTFNHGLGDACQFTVILRHLRKYRPDWTVDVWSLRGKHSAFHGLCRKSYHDQEEFPQEKYDRRFDIFWYENYYGYTDRPNSKITNCLAEVFGIPYDPALGRYQVQISSEAREIARNYLQSIGCQEIGQRFNAVLFHYEGNTSADKKNLSHEQITPMLATVLTAGYVPVILDWDCRSPLPDGVRIFKPEVRIGDIWGSFGTGDAERIAALIDASTAFVGIDSGPGKIASSTETPTLICWTRMHPIQFHDPAPNTLHLVPKTHENISPANKKGVADYFRQNYQHLMYDPASHHGPDGLVANVNDWLEKIMDFTTPENLQGGEYKFGFWFPPDKAEQAWTIIEDVFIRDSYRTCLRPRVCGEEFVVDIGANIGAFAKLWHGRNPKAKIACVEVHQSLLQPLRANVGEFAQVIPGACHYGFGLGLLDACGPEGKSIGGSMVCSVDEIDRVTNPEYKKCPLTVPVLTMGKICDLAGFPRIDILKLDCEGSEFSILENCNLDRIGTIFVESHDKARWRNLLGRRFQGWDIGHMYEHPHHQCEIWHLVNTKRPK
jgi:FkbM family methyltransferase